MTSICEPVAKRTRKAEATKRLMEEDDRLRSQMRLHDLSVDCVFHVLAFIPADGLEALSQSDDRLKWMIELYWRTTVDHLHVIGVKTDELYERSKQRTLYLPEGMNSSGLSVWLKRCPNIRQLTTRCFNAKLCKLVPTLRCLTVSGSLRIRCLKQLEKLTHVRCYQLIADELTPLTTVRSLTVKCRLYHETVELVPNLTHLTAEVVHEVFKARGLNPLADKLQYLRLDYIFMRDFADGDDVPVHFPALRSLHCRVKHSHAKVCEWLSEILVRNKIHTFTCEGSIITDPNLMQSLNNVQEVHLGMNAKKISEITSQTHPFTKLRVWCALPSEFEILKDAAIVAKLRQVRTLELEIRLRCPHKRRVIKDMGGEVNHLTLLIEFLNNELTTLNQLVLRYSKDTIFSQSLADAISQRKVLVPHFYSNILHVFI